MKHASLSIFLAALALGGCVFDNDPPHRLHPTPSDETASPAGDPTSTPPAASSSPSQSPSPMLVEVDADQTMTADGGEGVGVFIEYFKGGHWQLTWTCDTTKTHQSCDFAISASAASGTLTNVDASKVPSGSVSSPTSSRVEIRTSTSTELHSLRFDSAPGAVITVDAAVGGIKDGAFLFFVQDGKVNGGFTGKLTNPLQLQSNTP